jgi:Cft2 family RNA processing exonuclease
MARHGTHPSPFSAEPVLSPIQKCLLQDGKIRILVDCGLFQGFKPPRLRNWAPFQIPSVEISAVTPSHVHAVDHRYSDF